jgi:hypothetical protein
MTGMPAALKARVTADCKAAAVKLTTARPWQPRAPKPKAESTSPQARAFLRISKDIEDNAQKRRDLQEQPGDLRTRHYLEQDAERTRKYSIETGYDERTGAYRTAPLEPWTGPRQSMRLYQRLVFGDALTLADLQAEELAIIEWMRDEGLAGVDDNGQVRALSDAETGKRRTYPGAKVSDKKAAIGHQLRNEAPGLVLAAIANLTRGKATARGLRKRLAKAARHGGTMLTAYDITTEANAIKARRHDLDDRRYLSVSTVRALVKCLLKDGTIEEIEPPRAVRRQRSWRVIPRVFAAVAEIITGKREQDE